MKISAAWACAAAAGVAAALPCFAETVADRKGAVLADRADLADDPRWIYNDWERGFAEAKDSGKPLLVVLRCIPCLACAGIDAKVLLENTDLTPLLDRFVCVRVINANTLDLSRFQFDFDLSFSAMIFHGDGTILGRYGSWTHQKDPQEETTEGFRRTLEAALELHREYPANRESLAGKQGLPMAHRTPIEIPALEGRYKRELDWEGQVVQSCVHCHQIGDALRGTYRSRRESIPSNLIFPFPAPETIGIELAPEHVARVKSVAPDSLAAQAGVRAGDEISRLGGQPLVSAADFSWALHLAPDDGSLSTEVRRGETKQKLTIGLEKGWRSRSDISRRVGTWPMRAMVLGGLLLEDLSDDARRGRGLGANTMALFAKHVGEYGEHAAAKNAGFQKEDVIVELDGESGRRTEGEMIGLLLDRHPPGAMVKATVLRGDRTLELVLPMQ